MRKMLAIVGLAICITANAQTLQDSVESSLPQWPSMVFKTNPLMILWADLPLAAEYRIGMEYINGRHTATEIDIAYLGKSPLVAIYEDSLAGDDINLKIYGFRFQASHRIYLNGLFPKLAYTYTDYSPQGMYIAPHVSIGQVRVTTRYWGPRQTFFEITHFSMNMLIGRHFYYPNHITLDVYVGAGYKQNRWDEYENGKLTQHDPVFLGDYYHSNLKLLLGFNFGIHF